MKGDALRDRILGYLDHVGEDGALETLAVGVPGRLLHETLSRLVRSPDPDVVHRALLVAQDLGTIAPPALRAAYRRNLGRYGLVEAIEDNLRRDDLSVRRNAVYVLAKLYWKESLPEIVAAFHHFLGSDPLYVQRVLGEIYWLGGDGDVLIPLLLEHPNFLFRWALIARLSNGHSLESAAPLLEQMCHDASYLVRVNAAYELEWLRSAPDLAEPPLHYDDVEVRFSNHLSYSHVDYELSELEAFVESLCQRNELPFP